MIARAVETSGAFSRRKAAALARNAKAAIANRKAHFWCPVLSIHSSRRLS
jgi:hypothetical protein